MMKKKYISLTISVVLTLLIFSMSVLSGTDSGELSSGFSSVIKNIWDAIFINHPISLDVLHNIVRKGAHVFEYFILGISYYFTAKYWHLSILKVSVIGLLTAGVDEWIQSFVPERASRWIDVFVYDFGGFILGLGILLIILNRKPKKISSKEVLLRLENQEISERKAYKLLYNAEREHIAFTNRSHFAKLSIKIPDEPKVSKFLSVLFFIPFPLFIVRFAFRFIKLDKYTDEFSTKEILEMMNSKGIRIKVNAHSGEIINIKII